MADRRRINGPPSGTRPPVFASLLKSSTGTAEDRPQRTRGPRGLRKICKPKHPERYQNKAIVSKPGICAVLRTGLIPSATGSAYLEVQPSRTRSSQSLIAASSALKITCTVHGPRPLPRSAPFSPNLLLTTHVKYAPFAARRRKGHIRDASERDLGVHLETAIRGAIVAERWPKSALDITVTVLEAEDDGWWRDSPGSHDASWGVMNVLAGCITVASAAISDARIDCLDLVIGGVAALVVPESDETNNKHDYNLNKAQGNKGCKEDDTAYLQQLVMDPDPSEHQTILSACLVAYMPNRDEITELWLKGDTSRYVSIHSDKRLGHDALIDGAIDTARGIQPILAEAVQESAKGFFNQMAHVHEVLSSDSKSHEKG